jgi:hypothetical protein
MNEWPIAFQLECVCVCVCVCDDKGEKKILFSFLLVRNVLSCRFNEKEYEHAEMR